MEWDTCCVGQGGDACGALILADEVKACVDEDAVIEVHGDDIGDGADGDEGQEVVEAVGFGACLFANDVEKCPHDHEDDAASGHGFGGV